jgi:hypothetical protein
MCSTVQYSKESPPPQLLMLPRRPPSVSPISEGFSLRPNILGMGLGYPQSRDPSPVGEPLGALRDARGTGPGLCAILDTNVR